MTTALSRRERYGSRTASKSIVSLSLPSGARLLGYALELGGYKREMPTQGCSICMLGTEKGRTLSAN
uniref:Uncharacterized protein n=1 Tax=Arundo donax TaxID=35708 RepID=A0A0A9H9U9_ARUDO